MIATLTVLLLAATKWMLAVFLELSGGNRFWASALTLWSGGMAGVLFYTFLGRWTFRLLRSWSRPNTPVPDRPEKVHFNRVKRLIVRVRQRHGLLGIAVLTPVFLTVPIGTVAANIIEPRKSTVLVYMALAFAVWTLLFCQLDHWLQFNIGEWYKEILHKP